MNDLIEDRARLLQQVLSLFRQHHAAARAIKKPCLELLFEEAHVTTERRLREMCGIGGLGETARFRHHNEVSKLFEVHILVSR